MSKELEELIRLEMKFPELDKAELSSLVHLEVLCDEKLEALEIIKEKKVCVVWLRNGLSAYNSTAALYNLPRLNEEKYDLLRKVLLWDIHH